MAKTRGFEVVKRLADDPVPLPQRQTKAAAGYDLAAVSDFTLPSIWRGHFLKALWHMRHGKALTPELLTTADQELKPFLVPTGIKAFMQPDEVLLLVNRSSGPLKRRLILPNGVGVIDADYYSNDSNDGEIFVQLINYGLTDVTIKKGERIAQGIFVPFLTIDGETTPQMERNGGFGSSGKH
ncbi:dCTP deaminase/dUTPase family protein [Furfurilactobacillus curtus]|uniref:dUTP diphosphatase n=1 Tax=Furfurilactobacillus curtus TaxID=1746200 RepID=A0ABQ5JPK9_9LACO